MELHRLSQDRVSANQNFYETVNAPNSSVMTDEISQAVDEHVDVNDQGNPFLQSSKPLGVDNHGADLDKKRDLDRNRINSLAIKVESLESSVQHQLEKSAIEEAAFGKRMGLKGNGTLKERKRPSGRGFTRERVGYEVRSACDCIGSTLNNRSTRFIIAVIIILLLATLINEVRKLVIARAEQPQGMAFGVKGGDPEDDLDVPFGDIE
jgi:hypothetical protein